MAIINGNLTDPDDIATILITVLQGKIQIIKLCENASISDFDYDNAMVDIFSDSTGYNDTVDTGNTTGTYNSDEENYRAIETDASETNSTETSTSNTSWTLVKTITLSSAKRVTKHENETKSDGTTYYAKVLFEYDDSTSEYSNQIGGSNTTYLTKTYTNPHPDKGVTAIKVYLQVGSGGTAYESNDQVYAYTYASGVVQTISKTFDFNINNACVVAWATIPSNTSITVDISTDGGSTWDVTGQNLNSIVALDNDNTDLVIKFNLNTTNSAYTPRLYGYGVQLW